MTPYISLYLHIPFCRTRCTYCAFNTYTGKLALIPPYSQALQNELSLVASMMPSHYVVNTIYFGGGTPSLLPVHEIDAILARCTDVFELAPTPEITLETNPGTVSTDYLAKLYQAGVNRISIGMQSAHDAELRLMARNHTVSDVEETVQMARAAGFDNLSLDLIYGIPHQTQTLWQHTLNAAIRLNPEHLSLYSLSVEKATPLHRQITRGDLPLPDADRAADMIEWAAERLTRAGFEQYEISNWAKPGFACQHNLHIWQNLPYLGFGAGAHGCAANIRYSNALHPMDYITRLQHQPNQNASRGFPLSPAAQDTIPVDDTEAMADTMLLGLRLTQDGISSQAFRTRHGRDLWDVYGAELDRLIAYGLLERITSPQDRVRLTPRGRMLGNHVFAAFV